MKLSHLKTAAWLMLLLNINVYAAGLLTPKDGSLPALSIRDHKVGVIIEDGYAITSVDQVFHNPHGRDLEAIYSFPVPEHGAVAEFSYWIDGKPVIGEVLEKQEAKRIYEEEKSAGRETGITEKDGYKTFEVRVSPVRAGQDTRIRLVYLQPAHIDSGIGRYVYPLEEGGVDEEKLAFWTAEDKVTGDFSFDLQLRSAYPVDAVRVPNQAQARMTQQSAGEWRINLQGASTIDEERHHSGVVYTLDKDIVVYWRHVKGLPGSVDMVTYKPDAAKRGTFMLVVTPGDDLQAITEGRDWILILDISGSMQGKYATLVEGVQGALKKMNGRDRFRIILFNNNARELTSGFVNATPDAIKRYSQTVAKIRPQGGTNLYAGIQEGLSSLEADRTSAIFLVTDGVANVGETRQRHFLALLAKKDVRLFTFIMGNSANRPLLESLTKASNGFAISISNSDDIVGQLLLASSKVGHQALHGVRLDISGVKVDDITPKKIGSLYRGQQLVVFGHYWGDGMAQVSLNGLISGQRKSYQTRFSFPASTDENPEIERLWAYATIEELMQEMDDFGEKADLKQAVVDLGIEYSLVTDYTSMVVMRDEIFEQRGIERRNRARRQVEGAAQEQRTQRSSPKSNRVDSQQPMYQSNRPDTRSSGGGSSGGGALDIWYLLLLIPLMGVRARYALHS